MAIPGVEKKFKRDGAKYICLGCKKGYFTREDVEKCFDSHQASGGTSSSSGTPAPSGSKPKS